MKHSPQHHTDAKEDSSVKHPTGDDLSESLEATTQKGTGETTTHVSPAMGVQFDDYQLVSEVARGGMGIVYRARQLSLNRIVAVKMILGEDTDGDTLQRFKNEAEAAAALDHPGIVPVYEVGSYGNAPYFSMAFVEGQSLADQIAERPLQPKQAAEIAHQVSVAIAHAHDQRIIHRDIKPANILVDAQGLARITDFGVCKLLKGGADLTSSGELIGTPHYMPPEQAGGKDEMVGPTSDVYSIGAVLYAMLTGRPPFQAATPIEIVSQVISNDPISPRELNASIPVELEVITLKCLHKATRDRYQSASDLANDLNRFLNGEPIVARPPGRIRRLQLLIRKHVVLSSVSGTAAFFLVLLTVITSFAYYRSQKRVVELQELLETERTSGASRFARIPRASDPQVLESQFHIGRLNDTASKLNETQPDLALKLAIEAVTLAKTQSLEPPAESIMILQQAIDSDPQHDPSNLNDLLEEASRKVSIPWTEEDRLIYGITQ